MPKTIIFRRAATSGQIWAIFMSFFGNFLAHLAEIFPSCQWRNKKRHDDPTRVVLASTQTDRWQCTVPHYTGDATVWRFSQRHYYQRFSLFN